MNPLGTFYTIIFIALAVIQILMIVKFFQIAADVRALRGQNSQLIDVIKRLLPQQADQNSIPESAAPKEQIQETKTPNYTESAGTITFEDGISGEIVSAFGAYGYYGEDGKPVYFSDKAEAIDKLYIYLRAKEK